MDKNVYYKATNIFISYSSEQLEKCHNKTLQLPEQTKMRTVIKEN